MSDFRLSVFCCVAKHLSYTKAASELRISQPAITHHIHELENQYNLRLIERMGNKIQLTTAGTTLLKYSQTILDDYSKLSFAMNLLGGKHSGVLRLGASTTIAQYVLPPLLARFASQFSDIKLSLLNGNSEEIEKALISHSIDLGLIETDKRLPILKYTHFADDELVGVICAKSLSIAKEEMSLEELVKTPLVLRENGSGTLSVFESALKRNGLKLSDLNLRMQLGSSESIKLFLENSDTMSIISFRCVAKELSRGIFRVVELPKLQMKREFDFVQLQGDEASLSSVFMQFASCEVKNL